MKSRVKLSSGQWVEIRGNPPFVYMMRYLKKKEVKRVE